MSLKSSHSSRDSPLAVNSNRHQQLISRLNANDESLTGARARCLAKNDMKEIFEVGDLHFAFFFPPN